MRVPFKIRFRLVLFCLLVWGYGVSQAQLLEPPLPMPNGDSAFVGTMSVTFSNSGTSRGQIWYTLTGLAPTLAVHSLYTDTPILFEKTTTLKAVRVLSGSANSTVTTAIFRRAKLPPPVAHYGLSPNFSTSLTCSLLVAKDGISPFIRYTVDGTAPNALSSMYSVPLVFTHSTLLKAYATTPGYDDSDPMQIQFTINPPAAIPVATPSSQPFTTKTLIVRLKSASAGVQFRYTLDTNAALNTWPIALGDSVSLVGNTPGEIVVLRAQAFKTGTYFPSAFTTEKYTYTPQVLPIKGSKLTGFFYDNDTISLTTQTPGASIRYTLDGSQPVNTSTLATGPIYISDSVILSAVAFKPPQPQSETFREVYKLRLTPPRSFSLTQPLADNSTQQFQDSVSITLKSACPGAKIYYTLDGSAPTPSSTPYTGNAIDITQSNTVLSAIAIKGNVKSLISHNTFVKIAVIVKLSQPSINPLVDEFEVAQLITLNSDNSDAEIRYTLDNTLPSANSLIYTGPITINTTTTLHVQAYSPTGTFEPSDVGEMKYKLIPSMPTASPAAGSGPFLNQVQVTLKTGTFQGLIYYQLGDKPFDFTTAKLYTAGELITLKTTTTLQAITVLGTGPTQLKSTVLSQTYYIYTSLQVDTLSPGASTTLKTNIFFTNSSTVPILATVHSTNAFGLVGFTNAGFAIQLQSIPAGQTMNVSFTKPAAQSQSLYRIVNGIVEFVSANAQVKIVEGGEYFVGTDTLPPVITLLSQNARIGDSTSIRLLVRDNVANQDCEITSPGLPGNKLLQKPDGEGVLTAAFKNPGSEPKSLWFRAQITDYYNTTRFPKDPLGKYFLAQSWNNLVSPGLFTLGKKEYPWDMAGLPINAKAPITWGQLKNDNLESDLFAMVLKDSSGYIQLADDSLIRPGMSFWLGSLKPVASLAFSNFKAGESDSNGGYRLTLHHGWNQISDPALEKLYWPISRTGSNFSKSEIRGLSEFVPSIMDYAPTDSLEPWKGYFVYFYGRKDTVLALYTIPGKTPAAKGSGANALNETQVEQGVEISLDFGRPIPLILGASSQGQDDFSTEDEPHLPAWRPTFSAWSLRDKRQLSVDIQHFTPQVLLHWNVVVTHSSSSSTLDQAVAIMRIATAKLPAGYQAWAISRTTGIKYRLEQDGTLPLLELQTDTLSIYAGPLDKLAESSEFSNAHSSVEHFSIQLETGSHGQLFMNLALPWKSQVSIHIWSITGQLEVEMPSREFEEGFYKLPLSVLKSGHLSVLQVDLRGKNIRRTFSQKIMR